MKSVQRQQNPKIKYNLKRLVLNILPSHSITKELERNLANINIKIITGNSENA